jgi:short-subunit dehydrogenase
VRYPRALTVYPGPTRTERARRFAPPGASEARRMPPAALAERILRAVERRRSVLVPGLANRLFALAGHLAPRLTERVLARALLDGLEEPPVRPAEPDPNRTGRHHPGESG